MLRPHEAKLKCLCDAKGNSRLQHPLSPAVRTWYISPLAVEELLPEKSMEAVSIPLKSAKTTTEKRNIDYKKHPAFQGRVRYCFGSQKTRGFVWSLLQRILFFLIGLNSAFFAFTKICCTSRDRFSSVFSNTRIKFTLQFSITHLGRCFIGIA